MPSWTGACPTSLAVRPASCDRDSYAALRGAPLTTFRNRQRKTRYRILQVRRAEDLQVQFRELNVGSHRRDHRRRRSARTCCDTATLGWDRPTRIAPSTRGTSGRYQKRCFYPQYGRLGRCRWPIAPHRRTADAHIAVSLTLYVADRSINLSGDHSYLSCTSWTIARSAQRGTQLGRERNLPL